LRLTYSGGPRAGSTVFPMRFWLAVRDVALAELQAIARQERL
jgi:hypothetical protein